MGWVQDVVQGVDAGGVTHTTTTGTVGAGISTTAGNLLVLYFNAQGADLISAISDSKGNTWTKAVDIANGGSSASLWFTYQDGGTLAAGDTITVTHGTSPSTGFGISEYSGFGGGVDATATQVATGTTSISGSLTTLTNNALVVECLSFDGNDTFAIDNTETDRTHVFMLNGTVKRSAIIADSIQATAGAATHGGHVASGTRTWALAMASFVPDAGGTTTNQECSTTVTVGATRVRSVSKAVMASSTGSVSLVRQARKVLSVSTLGDVTKRLHTTRLRTLAAVAASSVVLQRGVRVTRLGTAGSSPSLLKRASKTFAALADSLPDVALGRKQSIDIVTWSTAQAYDTTDLAIIVPDSTAVGHMMIAQVDVRPGNAVITTVPDGWTEFGTQAQESTIIRQAVYWKVAGEEDLPTDDPTDDVPPVKTVYTWQTDIGTDLGGGILTFSGVDVDDPIDAVSNNNINSTTADNSPIGLSVTTDITNAKLVFLAATSNATSYDTQPSGFSEKYDFKVNLGASGRNMAATASIATKTATGASGNKTAHTVGTGRWVTHLVALRPGHIAGNNFLQDCVATVSNAVSALTQKLSSVVHPLTLVATVSPVANIKKLIYKTLVATGSGAQASTDGFDYVGFSYGNAADLVSTSAGLDKLRRWFDQMKALYPEALPGQLAIRTDFVGVQQADGSYSIDWTKYRKFATECGNAGIRWVPCFHFKSYKSTGTGPGQIPSGQSHYATPKLTGSGTSARMNGFKQFALDGMNEFGPEGSYTTGTTAPADWVPWDVVEGWNEPNTTTGQANYDTNTDGSMNRADNQWRCIKAISDALDDWVADSPGTRTRPYFVTIAYGAIDLADIKAMLDYADSNGLDSLDTMGNGMAVHIYSNAATDPNWNSGTNGLNNYSNPSGPFYSGKANPIAAGDGPYIRKYRLLENDLRPMLDDYCPNIEIWQTEGGFSGSDKWNKYQLNYGGVDASGAGSTSKIKNNVYWATPQTSPVGKNDEWDQYTLTKQALTWIYQNNAYLKFKGWFTYYPEDGNINWSSAADYNYWQNTRGHWFSSRVHKKVWDAIRETFQASPDTAGMTVASLTTSLVQQFLQTCAATVGNSATVRKLAKVTRAGTVGNHLVRNTKLHYFRTLLATAASSSTLETALNGAMTFFVNAVATVGSSLSLRKQAGKTLSTSVDTSLNPAGHTLLGVRTIDESPYDNVEVIQQHEALMGKGFDIINNYGNLKTNTAAQIPNATEQFAVDNNRILFKSMHGGTAQGNTSTASWQQIEAGDWDDVIIAAGLAWDALGIPWYFSPHHEPEDDEGSFTNPQNGAFIDNGDRTHFVAMYERWWGLWHGDTTINPNAVTLTNLVGMFPVLMRKSYQDPDDNGYPPESWYPEDESKYDFCGIDDYNKSDYGPDGWLEWIELAQEALDFAAARGKRLFVGEIGCYEQTAVPGRKATWYENLAAEAKSHEVEALTFQSNYVTPDTYSFTTSASAQEAWLRVFNDDPFFTQTGVPGGKPQMLVSIYRTVVQSPLATIRRAITKDPLTVVASVGASLAKRTSKAFSIAVGYLEHHSKLTTRGTVKNDPQVQTTTVDQSLNHVSLPQAGNSVDIPDSQNSLRVDPSSNSLEVTDG